MGTAYSYFTAITPACLCNYRFGVVGTLPSFHDQPTGWATEVRARRGFSVHPT
jgi:hypothetical protein